MRDLENRQILIAVGKAIALFIVSFVSAVGVAAMIGTEFAPKGSGDLAAWMQAVGSVAAIAIAYLLGADNARMSRIEALRQRSVERNSIEHAKRIIASSSWVQPYLSIVWGEGGHYEQAAILERRKVIESQTLLCTKLREWDSELDQLIPQLYLRAKEQKAVMTAKQALWHMITVIEMTLSFTVELNQIRSLLDDSKDAYSKVRRVFKMGPVQAAQS